MKRCPDCSGNGFFLHPREQTCTTCKGEGFIHMNEIPESVIPRRNRIDRLTPPEKAIYDAIQAVEVAGAHTLLTEAVVLLGQAKDKVADFVDAGLAETERLFPSRESAESLVSLITTGKSLPERIASLERRLDAAGIYE